MNFLDELILATLNEWQGATLSAEQVALIIDVKDINKVRTSLDKLSDRQHIPVINNDEGYTIPNNTMKEYILGFGGLTAILSLALFL